MDEVTQSLEEWDGPELREGPLNDAIAAVMMRRMASLSRKIHRREETAAFALEMERVRVAEWLDAETASAREQVAQLEARLCEYALDVRDAYDRKSVSLPHGKVQTRESGGGWKVVDGPALLEWAKVARPDLVRVKEEFKVADARLGASGLAATDDGEVVVVASGEGVPGIKVEAKVVTASVVIGGAS